MSAPIVKRYNKNPILTRDDIPYPVATVHNAAVTKTDSGYVMLFRSHLNTGRSIIGIADSDDGYAWTPRHQPFITPTEEEPYAEYEEFGVEDPRLCTLDGRHLITYSAYSRYGVRIHLGETKDFQSFSRVAMISQTDSRNTVLFPEKINGEYIKLDRPHSEISPWSIWLSYSPDLIHWGRAQVVMKPVPYHWDEMKIGPGATPIKTPDGWLHIYHGVFPTMAGAVYRLGVCLHDLEDPTNVQVYEGWILQPESPYEVSGYVPNVVFSCAAVPEEDDEVKIYWGGADQVMCVGTASIEELVSLCKTQSRPAL